jgi:hypothetical protein
MKETPFERHLEYVNEGTIEASGEVYLYVQNDENWGLKVPADSGYVKNDGPGELIIRNSDDGEHYTPEMTVKSGENLTWENDDDVWNHTIHIVADASGASYRSRFARSRW